MALIPESSTIISAGLADDLSFDMELILRKHCFVVGIDPTRLSKHTVKRLQDQGVLKSDNFVHIEKALYGNSDDCVTLGGPAVTVFSSTGREVSNDQFK